MRGFDILPVLSTLAAASGCLPCLKASLSCPFREAGCVVHVVGLHAGLVGGRAGRTGRTASDLYVWCDWFGSAGRLGPSGLVWMIRIRSDLDSVALRCVACFLRGGAWAGRIGVGSGLSPSGGFGLQSS